MIRNIRTLAENRAQPTAESGIVAFEQAICYNFHESGRDAALIDERGEAMNRKREWTQKQRRIMSAAVLVLLALAAAWAFLRVGKPILKLVADPAEFREWVQARGFAGVLASAGMVIVQVLVALIPGEPLEIAAGYAFGAFEGTLICITAAALGSLLVFALVRRFGMKLVGVFFSKDKLSSLRFLQRSRRRDYLFAVIFMLPGTPKDLLCYFAGLTDMKFGTWLLICSVGRIPSVVTSTIGGDALGTKSYLFAVVVFVLTLAVSAAGVFFYRQIQKRHAARKGRAGADS